MMIIKTDSKIKSKTKYVPWCPNSRDVTDKKIYLCTFHEGIKKARKNHLVCRDISWASHQSPPAGWCSSSCSSSSRPCLRGRKEENCLNQWEKSTGQLQVESVIDQWEMSTEQLLWSVIDQWEKSTAQLHGICDWPKRYEHSATTVVCDWPMEEGPSATLGIYDWPMREQHRGDYKYLGLTN